MNKVIVRVKGGLGNQLWCFAAARRLAMANDAELVLDDVTGFARDALYRRQYSLRPFRIPARLATPAERLEPFERARRFVHKQWSRRQPFAIRSYLEQEQLDFDERLLARRVEGTLRLDGLWMGEGYLQGSEEVIRRELEIDGASFPARAVQMARRIRAADSVAIHVRWFDSPGQSSAFNAGARYYGAAIARIRSAIERPHFFVFSDRPDAAAALLGLAPQDSTVVDLGLAETDAYVDLWLMSQCRHFIIANSTFSWWAAWLGEREPNLTIAPRLAIDGKTAWGFKGLLPDRWLTL